MTAKQGEEGRGERGAAATVEFEVFLDLFFVIFSVPEKSPCCLFGKSGGIDGFV